MKKTIFICISILLIASLIFVGNNYFNNSSHKKLYENVEVSNQASVPKTEIDEKADETIVVELPVKEDTQVNLAVIGDIMCHNSQYIDAYNASEKT